MKLLKRLTKSNLKCNKKRTLVTIIGIILAVALLTAVSTMVTSFQQSLILYEKENSGDYHYGFLGVPEEELDAIRQNRNVESSYEMAGLGYAVLEGCVNEDKPYLYVEAMDKGSMENSSLTLKAGRLPENEKELVISNHIKTNGGVNYKIGDTITLQLGKRYAEDFQLDQSNPYNGEETLEYTNTRTFTVVGVCERLSYMEEERTAPGYTVITCLTDELIKESEEYCYGMDIYVRFTKQGLKNQARAAAQILGVDAELFQKVTDGEDLSEKEWKEYNEQIRDTYRTAINNRLMEYETLSFGDGILGVIFKMAIVVLVIIICTSAFCISNSFSISITEKMRQYGMLASVGATPKQIMRNVYYEAFVLGIISIPIGIVCGISACFILIKTTGSLLGDYINFDLIFQPSLAGILTALLLSVITIYLSSRRPAKKAAKVSPIVAISGAGEIKLKQKKLKVPGIIRKLFGIGGILAYKNRKRYKRKYRVAVISIAVSVTTFIALYSFMNLVFKSADFYSGADYSLSVYLDADKSHTEETKKLIKALENMNEVYEFSVWESAEYEMQGDIRYSAEHKKEEDSYNGISVSVLGDAGYAQYVKKLGLSVEEAEQGAILINKGLDYDEKTGQNIIYDIFDYQPGDSLFLKECIYDEEGEKEETVQEKEIKIAAVTDEWPLGLKSHYFANGMLVVSNRWLEENSSNINSRGSHIYIDCEDADGLQQFLVDEYEISVSNITNREEIRRQERALYTVIAIFLYGFIIVISLIGVTNIFNTVTTSMELRSREFAMLISVGMTKKEFNRMVGLESVFYGGTALLAGMVFGNVLSYVFYRILAGNLSYTFQPPVAGMVIAAAAVVVLLYGIMKYSTARVQRQNIIETIRQENR